MRPVLLPALVALALAFPASAGPCGGGGLVDRTVIVLHPDPLARYYLDVREIAGEEAVHVHVYQEANRNLGGPWQGLQTGFPCSFHSCAFADLCWDPDSLKVGPDHIVL